VRLKTSNSLISNQVKWLISKIMKTDCQLLLKPLTIWGDFQIQSKGNYKIKKLQTMHRKRNWSISQLTLLVQVIQTQEATTLLITLVKTHHQWAVTEHHRLDRMYRTIWHRKCLEGTSMDRRKEVKWCRRKDSTEWQIKFIWHNIRC
jgi:hypothetical protein